MLNFSWFIIPASHAVTFISYCPCSHNAGLLVLSLCTLDTNKLLSYSIFVATCKYMNMTDFNNTLDMHVCFFKGLVCAIHWLLLLASSIHIVSKAVV